MPTTATPTIPVEKFGKDHWSLLAYIETVCVDGKGGIGAIDRRKVRSLVDNGAGAWRENWGTRLAGYFELPKLDREAAALAAGVLLPRHDDWACLEDLESAGFVEQMSEANSLVRLTEAGQAMSAQLRVHKQSDGGYFSNFRPETATTIPVTAPGDIESGDSTKTGATPDEPHLMTPPWSEANDEAAVREGWNVFSSHGSDNGNWQIQRFDDADEATLQKSFIVPALAIDEDAWRLVMEGEAAHHVAAREFIAAHNPIEWAAMVAMSPDAKPSQAAQTSPTGTPIQDRG